MNWHIKVQFVNDSADIQKVHNGQLANISTFLFVMANILSLQWHNILEFFSHSCSFLIYL